MCQTICTVSKDKYSFVWARTHYVFKISERALAHFSHSMIPAIGEFLKYRLPLGEGDIFQEFPNCLSATLRSERISDDEGSGILGAKSSNVHI